MFNNPVFLSNNKDVTDKMCPMKNLQHEKVQEPEFREKSTFRVFRGTEVSMNEQLTTVIRLSVITVLCFCISL